MLCYLVKSRSTAQTFLQTVLYMGGAIFAQANSDPGNVPVIFNTPVDHAIFLTAPGSQHYQYYAPSGAFEVGFGGRLTLTDGAFMRYGGNILNDGTIILGSDSSSNRVGGFEIRSNGASITLAVSADNTSLNDGRGTLRMLGGSIYKIHNFFFPNQDTARVINGPGHLITNSDGILYVFPLSGPAYTGNLSGLQLTNQGDIESVRSGGRLSLGLLSLSNTGGAGQHFNSATGRIFAYDEGLITISIGWGAGNNNRFNTFTNDGLIATYDPRVLTSSPIVPTGGGTIRFSSAVDFVNSFSPGVFRGNNPVVYYDGRLELDEIRFINTLPPASPGGTPIPKTLTAFNGTIRLENGVTIEGGRIAGDTGDSRFEIGFGGAPAGGYANTFVDVEFDGTFFARGHLRLLGATDLSSANFRPLTPGAGYTLALGSDLALTGARTFVGRVGFTTDASVTTRTLTLGGSLTAPDSVGFSQLALAGSGVVISPVIRVTGPLDLSSYGGVLRPQAGGQLRLENNTFSFPFSPKLSSSGATLVLDAATLDLAAQTLDPAALNTSVRIENNSVLQNGTLLAGSGPGGAPTGTFHIEQGRLRDVTFEGVFTVGQSVTLENATPTGQVTGFSGQDYSVIFASPLDLAGAPLRLLSTGTVSLNTTSGGSLPTGGPLVADRLRLVGNLRGLESGTQLAAGPSGELHLALDTSAFSFINTTTVTGNLRLESVQPNLQPNPVPIYLNSSTALSVDGHITLAPHLSFRSNIYFPSSNPANNLQFLPPAIAARAFNFESGNLSGLHLRPYEPAAPAFVNLRSGETDTLAAAGATTWLSGGTIIVRDEFFTFDPADPSRAPSTTALVVRAGTNPSSAGRVESDGTVIFSGVGLTSHVTESVTPIGQNYQPSALPAASELGTIYAQHLTLRDGTQAHTRYASFQQEAFDNNGNTLGMEHIRRWILAPNLDAGGELRLETGHYALESTWTYGRLALGNGSTLTQRSLIASTPFAPSNFVGDSSALDPDLAALPDTTDRILVRAPSLSGGIDPGHALVFDGGRLEGMMLSSFPEYFSANTRSGALVSTRATFAADSLLVGTLDHATGAVTRFEGGYRFAPGALDANTGQYEWQLLRPSPDLAASNRRFGIEIAATPTATTVVVRAVTISEEYTRLQGDVTITGVADASGTNPRAQLLLEGYIPELEIISHLHHSDGDLTFAGPLDVVVNGSLVSTGRTTFESGVNLSGTGHAESTGGFQLNGQTLPGNSPGTLTLVGDVTFGPTHDLILEIGYGPWDSDSLFVNGVLNVSGSLTLVFINGFNPLAPGHDWPGDSTGQLINATSFGGSFTSFEIQGLDPVLFNEAQFAQILPAGLYAAIPEPSTWSLLAGALTLGFALLRRRRGPPLCSQRCSA